MALHGTFATSAYNAHTLFLFIKGDIHTTFLPIVSIIMVLASSPNSSLHLYHLLRSYSASLLRQYPRSPQYYTPHFGCGFTCCSSMLRIKFTASRRTHSTRLTDRSQRAVSLCRTQRRCVGRSSRCVLWSPPSTATKLSARARCSPS